jgi:hypothetical protein
MKKEKSEKEQMQSKNNNDLQDKISENEKLDQELLGSK